MLLGKSAQLAAKIGAQFLHPFQEVVLEQHVEARERRLQNFPWRHVLFGDQLADRVGQSCGG